MLGSNVKRYSLVIDTIDEANHINITSDDIYQWLLENEGIINFYAYILHDKDVKMVNDQVVPKIPHFHLVIEFEGSRSDSKIINDLALKFKCNKFLISCRPATKDWVTRVRYLTHIDDKDKYQYEKTKVVTNNVFVYDEYYSGIDKDVLTVATIRSLCINCDDIYDVYNFIGLKNAKAYRFIINDIWERVSLERHNRMVNQDLSELPFERN